MVFEGAEDSRIEAPEGWLVLSWKPSADEEPTGYELQRSGEADFADATLQYGGPDVATFISGLPEGKHYFRIRPVADDGTFGAWSETLAVDVVFVSRRTVLVLMLTGMLVLILTVGAIVAGSIRMKGGRDGTS